MSGTYVQTGLIAEFGKIPPSFLPLGNRRLYWHQIAMLQSHCDQVFLTVPDDFELPQKDVVALANLGAQVLPSDRSRTIAEALLDGMSSIPQLDGPLVVLYGDTLFSDQVALPSDVYSAHVAVDEYKWTPAAMISGADAKNERGLVVSGLYSFSSTTILADALSNCNGDIIEALRIYDQSLPLQMLTQGSWFDFGHAQTYYTSCGLITTQRSFNSLKITRQSVEKSSDDIQKMEAEASWFEALPAEMRVYAPTFLGRIETDGKTTGYRTQNTYLSTLANLSTFGRLNKNTWSSIFAACKEFLDETGVVA